MKKVFLVIPLIVLFFTACNNESRAVDIQAKSIEIDKEFIVKIKYKTNKAGTFNLALYNINASESQNIWIQISEEVAATTAMENLTAYFGKNISNSFRIGLGNNEEREIEFQFIDILYGQNTLHIIPKELEKYFKFNEFVSQDINTYKLQTIKVGEKLNPMLFFKKEYLEELKQD